MQKSLFTLSITFLLIFQISISSNCLFAQSLDVTGTSNVYGNPGLPLASHITVKNITSDTLGVMCEKIIIDTAAGTSNYFCWGTSCWPSSTYVSPIPAGVRTIPPGFGDSTNFVGYYDAFGNSAQAIVQYCFYPQGTPSDASCLTVTYNGSSTQINESIREIGLNEFFPNPTNTKTSIRYIADNNSQLHIIDILGNRIKSFNLDYSGLLEMNTNDLNKGIYFGNLVIDNKLVAVKKLIIN
jgi:hypothetical protein